MEIVTGWRIGSGREAATTATAARGGLRADLGFKRARFAD